MPHVSKFAGGLRVDDLTLRIDDGDSRYAFFQGNAVPRRKLNILIHMADIYVDYDVMTCQEIDIGRVMQVDIQNLTVATPITTEDKQDAFVILPSLPQSCIDIGLRFRDLRIDMLVHRGYSRWCYLRRKKGAGQRST